MALFLKRFIKGNRSKLQMITEKQRFVSFEFLSFRKNKVAQSLSFFKDLAIRDRLAYLLKKNCHAALKGNYHTALRGLTISFLIQILFGFQLDGNLAICTDQPNAEIDLKVEKEPAKLNSGETSNVNDSFATKYPGATAVMTGVIAAAVTAISTGGPSVKGVAIATAGAAAVGAMQATSRELKITKEVTTTVGTRIVEPIDTIPTSPTSSGNTITPFSIKETQDPLADRFVSPTGNEPYNIDAAIKFLTDHPFFLNNLDRIIYNLTILVSLLLLLTGFLFWGILLSRYSVSIVNLFKKIVPEKYHYLLEKIQKIGQEINSFYLIVIAIFLFGGLVFTLYVLYTLLSFIKIMKGS